jgi:hypothetical protein
MVGHEPFEMHNGHWVIELATATLHLAGPAAHPATHAGKRVGPFEYLVGVVNASSPDKGDVSRDIHFHRTGVLTGTLKKGGTDSSRTPFFNNVDLVFLSEIADGAEDWVGCSLILTTQGCVSDLSGQAFEEINITLPALTQADPP